MTGGRGMIDELLKRVSALVRILVFASLFAFIPAAYLHTRYNIRDLGSLYGFCIAGTLLAVAIAYLVLFLSDGAKKPR